MPIQLAMELKEKIDEPLARLFDEPLFRASERFPVVVRLSEGRPSDVHHIIEDLGGTVRFDLDRLQAVAAWLPLSTLSALVARSDVTLVELDQDLTIA